MIEPYKCVDVVIPTYNNSKFIKNAIDSVEDQNEWIRKIYVVDDGSTDNTKKIVNKLIKTYKNIEYFRQKNKGPSSARNLGLKKCRSQYVALLDADDIWLEGKIEAQIKVFKKSKFKNLAVVYGEYIDIDESGNKLPNFPSLRLDKKVRGNCYEAIVTKNCVAGSDSAVLIKRNCFKKSGYFDEKLQACEDWDLWIRLAKDHAFDYVNFPIIAIRRHKHEIQRDSRKMLLSTIAFLKKKQLNGIHISEIEVKTLRIQIIRHIIKNLLNFKLNKELIRSLKIDFIHSSGNLTKDFLDAMYGEFKLARTVYLFITQHVFPPFRNYIYKPIKRSFQKTK